MKLQHLIIIFLIIMLPMTLIMSQYTNLQIDTLSTKTKCDTALLGATFDAMSAFELNTINSDSSSVVGQEIRDLEAIISTFNTSLSSSLGSIGLSNSDALSYVPAIVFGLYDGYYIYSQNDTGTGRELKPYVYYTKTYTNGNDVNITIAYSLDNYVSIYGKYGSGNDQKISAAGYLVVPDDVEIIGNLQYENIKDANGRITKKVINPGDVSVTYKDCAISLETTYENRFMEKADSTIEFKTNIPEETTEAMIYYNEAKKFTEKYNDVISKLRGEDQEKLLIKGDNDPENEASNFMNEKINVMKDSITKNLNNAIYNYEGAVSDNYDMPQLNGEDWDKILNNISMITFLKDVPIGATRYNNYVVVNSTTNQKYCNPKSIEFIQYYNDGKELTDGYYHKITCSEFINNYKNSSKKVEEVVGYPAVDFKKFKHSSGDSNQYSYYYKHNEYACYECEVESIGSRNVATIKEYIEKQNLDPSQKKQILSAYYTAVGRIRYRLPKASSYINID